MVLELCQRIKWQRCYHNMKKCIIKTIQLILLFLEIILLYAVAFLLSENTTPLWINILIFLMLLVEIIVLYKLNNRYVLKPSKCFIGVCVFLLCISLIIFMTIKLKIHIPTVYMAAYEFSMGYLSLNALSAFSKTRINSSSYNKYKVLGILLFVFSVVMGFLSLLNIAY